MATKKKLLSTEDGKVAKNQHKTPCSDCPFRRDAVRGWLGGESSENYYMLARYKPIMTCHVRLTQQCAGAAIFRANTCTSVRGEGVLELPRNTKVVFANPIEFLAHHRLSPTGRSTTFKPEMQFLRPTQHVRKSFDPAFPTLNFAELEEHVMVHLHGKDWRTKLKDGDADAFHDLYGFPPPDKLKACPSTPKTRPTKPSSRATKSTSAR